MNDEATAKQGTYLGSRRVVRRCDAEEALGDARAERVASAGVEVDLDVVMEGQMVDQGGQNVFQGKVKASEAMQKLIKRVDELEARVRALEGGAQ